MEARIKQMQNLRMIHVILVNTCKILGYLAIESDIHFLAVFFFQLAPL